MRDEPELWLSGQHPVIPFDLKPKVWVVFVSYDMAGENEMVAVFSSEQKATTFIDSRPASDIGDWWSMKMTVDEIPS